MCERLIEAPPVEGRRLVAFSTEIRPLTNINEPPVGHRDVAIKVLPDTFANDADRLTRFTREAQVLASLNHPNIAAIYGVEERALVLELVEGATLCAHRTRRDLTG